MHRASAYFSSLRNSLQHGSELFSLGLDELLCALELLLLRRGHVIFHLRPAQRTAGMRKLRWFCDRPLYY